MKTKVKFKRIIAVLIVTVLLLSTLHLGLSSFADNASNSIMLNDCSGEGTNTASCANIFNGRVVKDASDDGHAFKATLKGGAIADGAVKTTNLSLKATPEGLTNAGSIKAFSIRVEIPASKIGPSIFSFRTKESDTFRGTVYAISDNGTVEEFDKGLVTLNGFKGLLVMVLGTDNNAISVNYTKYYLGMEDYVNEFGFTKVLFWMQNYASDCPYVIVDNLTAYFDTQSALDAIEEAKNYVPRPLLSYTGKTVYENHEISLTSDQGDLDIYYTLDGSDPTIESNKYDVNAPIKITKNCTLKAVAYRNGNYSKIISHDYVVYKESDYKTEVLQDGSSIGKVSQVANQAVTPNVNGVSPDDSCVEIKLLGKSVAPFTPAEVVYDPAEDVESTTFTANIAHEVKATETIGDTLSLTCTDPKAVARLISKDISINENFKDYAAMVFKVRITNKKVPNLYLAKKGSSSTAAANALTTKYYTVNTLTGVVNVSDGVVSFSEIQITDDVFEGYIVAVIDDETVINFQNTTYTWDTWLEAHKAKNDIFNIWIRQPKNTGSNIDGFQMGEVSFVNDLDIVSPLYVETNPKALSQTSPTANEIKTVHYWLKNPKGNGDINVALGCRSGSEFYGFVPGTYYLVDLATATYTKVDATSDYVTIPDGFEGYIVYDATTASNIDKIVSDNYANLTMQYILPDMQLNNCWYYDNITVSDLETQFTAFSLADACVTAPYVKTISSYIKQGGKVELFAEDGAEIYYTTDGTVPTTASNKYDAANLITITANTTIKAIAVVDGVKSVTSSFEYLIIDPNTPNFTILNDATDEAGFSTTVSAETSLVDNVSPNGSAYNLSGNATSGTGVITFNLSDMDTDYMLAHDVFAFWVKVPGNKAVTVSTAFNSNTKVFNGNILTFDTDNGTITTTEDTSDVTLSGFEGYVMLKLDDSATIGDYKWHEFLSEEELISFVLNVQNHEFLDNPVAFDTFGFVADYDEFIEELNSTAIRPDAPYTPINSGITIEGKNLLLYAGTNTDIFYTLDGTDPTINSTKYVLASMGGAQGEFSPIDILSDLTIKMIAVRDGVSSGIATYSYTVDPKYTGPDAVILNDGSGEGLNTVKAHNNFDLSVVNDASEDGNAFKFTLQEGAIEAGKKTNQTIRFNLNPDEVVSPMQIKAFSMRLEVPESEEGTTAFYFRHAGEANTIRGRVFAIGDDGVVKQFETAAGYFQLNGFKGTILMLVSVVGVNYSKYTLSLEEYVKNFGFAESVFTLYLQNYRSDCDYVIVDNLTAYYDSQKALEAFNIEGLLADYSTSTYENANMMVSNDCSGAKIYSGINSFSETITLEKSTVSKDDRNIAATLGKGEGFIELANYCKDEKAITATGITFWVQLPKGCGDTAINLKINENHQEMFSYGSQYYHYLIDVDGVISKVEGEIVLPDGFRGWVVIPSDTTILLEESVEFNNCKVDFNNIASTTLVFKNENNALDGKTVYIDDISWYADFASLVKSRAYQWAGQVFEN